MRSGSGPISVRLAAYQRGHSAAIADVGAPGPRCRAAIPHSVSLRRTTTSPAVGAPLPGEGDRRFGEGRARTTGCEGVHPGPGGAPSVDGDQFMQGSAQTDGCPPRTSAPVGPASGAAASVVSTAPRAGAPATAGPG